MKTLRTWVCSARLPGPALAALLLAGTLAPAGVFAHQGHEHGNVIANADGDNVRLRSGPSYEDGEITRFPEGTGVDVLDGPFDAADGSIWYQVDIDGQTGYMDSAFLAAVEVDDADGGTDVAEIPSGPTSGMATTNDSVYLRSGPSTADAMIRTLDAGEQVTLTGGARAGWNSVSATDGDAGSTANCSPSPMPRAERATRSIPSTCAPVQAGPSTRLPISTLVFNSNLLAGRRAASSRSRRPSAKGGYPRSTSEPRLR